jgi:hypothetical protein
MAPLGANQDAKTANGSGELVSETAPMEKRPAPRAAGNMFARLRVLAFCFWVLWERFCIWAVVQPAETDACAVRR